MTESPTLNASETPSLSLLKHGKEEESFGTESVDLVGSGSSFLPSLQRFWKYLRDPRNKVTIMFWVTIIVGFAHLGIKIADLVLLCTLGTKELPGLSAWKVFLSINLGFLVQSLTSVLGRRYLHTWGKYVYRSGKRREVESDDRHHGDTENLLKKEAEPVEKDKMTLVHRITFCLHVATSGFILITSVVFLGNSSSAVLSKTNYTVASAVVIGFQATDCALAVLYFIVIIIYLSLPFVMVAQALTIIVSILNVLMSILCIWANQTSRYISNINQLTAAQVDQMKYIMRHVRAFPYFGVILAASSGVGITAGVTIDATNRLSDTGALISMIYIVFNSVSFVINVVYLSLSSRNVRLFQDHSIHYRDIMISDPLISFVGMMLNVCGVIAMLKVRERPKSTFVVEEYDLSKLSENQLKVWIKLIDVYNKRGYSNPDSASGAEAISLLQAYTQCPMAHMNCRVLRVYDVGAKAYEKIKAWERLDQSDALDDDQASLLPESKANYIDSSAQENAQGLSKNAAKRARLKAAKKAAKKNGGNPNINSASTIHDELQKSPEEIKRDTQFRNDLIATEALVLLTCIEDFNLLSPILGSKFGKFVDRLVGARSPFRLTCIRMGLLATHWPFRQSLLFTAPTKRPNARSAAVCRAIGEYNRKLPHSKRCTMILNPTVSHRGQEYSIKPSGWAAVPLPPSHVVDLRPYQGNTLQEYLKKIKYRDQSKNFVRAKGEVIETKDFTEENCQTAINLWWNIASKRVADGNTSVLANPTVAFLQGIGTVANEKGYRSLLFLKVDDEIIASAVLFRLGDTITSDLQGLDHEQGRKYNAYFVMMQETIAIALKSGIKFVDFGPTTSQPKMAIGCKEVELYGGVYARPPLSWCVSMFSSEVHVDEG